MTKEITPFRLSERGMAEPNAAPQVERRLHRAPKSLWFNERRKPAAAALSATPETDAVAQLQVAPGIRKEIVSADLARKLELERNRLRKELATLREVMVAAAEEIGEHWDAHCDAEGYGPANLERRLLDGLATSYPGYSVGAFTALHERAEKAESALAALQKQLAEAGSKLLPVAWRWRASTGGYAYHSSQPPKRVMPSGLCLHRDATAIIAKLRAELAESERKRDLAESMAANALKDAFDTGEKLAALQKRLDGAT